MSTKSSFLTIALLVYASATHATLDAGLPVQWVDDESFIKMTSVQKRERGRIVFPWVVKYDTLQQVPNRPLNYPLYYTMLENRWAVDCNSKMIGVYAQLYLDENGHTVASGRPVEDPDIIKLEESVEPGTLKEKAINIVCDVAPQNHQAPAAPAIKSGG